MVGKQFGVYGAEEGCDELLAESSWKGWEVEVGVGEENGSCGWEEEGGGRWRREL